ncbi:ABC-type transport auxiliary lipoprotein family protein [Roseovarius tibetensis]|uniref:ABC-type transport auxiliary lipoprotein family protein n=1 Tax=Roseovarius tibetensis TaxID=2685897 RepID=UPI003D7F2FBC
MTPLRSILFPLVALALSGCAAITAVNEATTPLQAYELRAPADTPTVRGSLQRDLVIETPSTSGALDTDRIMIRPSPVEVAYLPASRWTDNAPVMLTTLMVRSFADTNALRYVGRRPLGGSADYTLISELTDFQAELGPDGTTATTRVRLSAQLVRGEDTVILGSRTVETASTVASTETADLVAGFDQATTAALNDLRTWALRRMGLGVSG